MAYTPISFEDPVQDRIRQQFRLGQLQQMVGQQPGAAIAPAAPVPVAGGGLARQIVGGLGGIGGWMGGAALASKFIPHPAAQIGIPLLASILAPKLAEGAVDTVAPGMLDSSAGMAVPGAIGLAAYLATRGKAGKVPGVSTVVATKPAGGGPPLAGSTTPPPVVPSAPGGGGAAMSSAPAATTAIIPVGGVRGPAPVFPVRGHLAPDLGMQVGSPQFTAGVRRGVMDVIPDAPFIMPPAVSGNAMDNPTIARAFINGQFDGQFGAQMKTSKPTPTVFKLRKVIESSLRNRRDAGTRSRPPTEGKFANTGKENLVGNNYPSLEDEALAEYLKTQKKK